MRTPTPSSLMKFTLLAMGVGLVACAHSHPPPSEIGLYCAPIDVAISTAPQVLAGQAAAGDTQSQLAYALVLANGLNGTPIDKSASDGWRAKAAAPSGTRMSSIYVPGGKHQAGRVMMVSLPTYDAPIEQQVEVDRCVAALNTPAFPKTITRVDHGECGGAENFKRLFDAWTKAKSADWAASGRSSPPVQK